jgi:hypothetical protein
MKKVVMLLLVVLCAFGITNVYAEEVYYTNQNGVELTREEYEFLSTFHNPIYPTIMTRDMYDQFAESGMINNEIQTVRYIEPQLPLLNPSIPPTSQSHSTSYKTVQISAACSNKCYMDLQATWHVSPSVRSWDNIGAYLDGVNLISHDGTFVYSTSGLNWYNYLNTTNGVGNSVELPSTGENIIVDMSFTVGTGGTVYGSYQHAMQTTTLANSQNYTLDILGYGEVFSYYGNAIGVYDGMNGVDIDV